MPDPRYVNVMVALALLMFAVLAYVPAPSACVGSLAV